MYFFTFNIILFSLAAVIPTYYLGMSSSVSSVFHVFLYIGFGLWKCALLLRLQWHSRAG